MSYLLVGIVPADCIVELGDEEVEKQVDKVVAKRGQAMDKVVESAVIGSFYQNNKFGLAHLNERTVRGL